MKYPSSQKLQFYLDDESIEIPVANHQATLLDFIRLQKNNTSVKEGCAEGDCGACMVLMAELQKDPTEGECVDTCQAHLIYRPVNSCIKLLPSLHRKSIHTLSYLSSVGEALHPVQDALINCHASQCGFCTPGFVISLLAQGLQTQIPITHEATMDHPKEAEIINAISGNLCRCTGYRPIIDAGLHLSKEMGTGRFSRQDAYSEKRLKQQFNLENLPDLMTDQFMAPSDLATFARLYAENPYYQILAGGTDVGLWVTQHLKQLAPTLYLGCVKELKIIEVIDDVIRIGAGISLEVAFQKIVEYFPELDQLHHRFASLPIRQTGTFCGNIANGSPIGDCMPILLALNAKLILRCGEMQREISLDQFYLGYQKKDLQAGEFVEAVMIPLKVDHQIIASYKISKRFEQDISAICIGLSFIIEEGFITSARIAFGGMAATPKRAMLIENDLLGKAWNLPTLMEATSRLEQEFDPISDLRASHAYRLLVAKNLFIRFYHEKNNLHTSIHDQIPIYPQGLQDA